MQTYGVETPTATQTTQQETSSSNRRVFRNQKGEEVIPCTIWLMNKYTQGGVTFFGQLTETRALILLRQPKDPKKVEVLSVPRRGNVPTLPEKGDAVLKVFEGTMTPTRDGKSEYIRGKTQDILPLGPRGDSSRYCLGFFNRTEDGRDVLAFQINETLRDNARKNPFDDLTATAQAPGAPSPDPVPAQDNPAAGDDTPF